MNLAPIKHVSLVAVVALVACAPKPEAATPDREPTVASTVSPAATSTSTPSPTTASAAPPSASNVALTTATAAGPSSTGAAPATKSSTAKKTGAKPPEVGPGYREFNHDVTRGHNDDALEKSGVPKRSKRRVVMRVYPTSVAPENARSSFATEDIIWTARAKLAHCYYLGPGRDPTAEETFVATTTIDKYGVVVASKIDKAAPIMTEKAVDECLFTTLKGLNFGNETAEARATWELRFRTLDGATLPDFNELPIK